MWIKFLKIKVSVFVFMGEFSLSFNTGYGLSHTTTMAPYMVMDTLQNKRIM